MLFQVLFLFPGKKPIRRNIEASSWFPALTIAGIEVTETPTAIVIRPATFNNLYDVEKHQATERELMRVLKVDV